MKSIVAPAVLSVLITFAPGFSYAQQPGPARADWSQWNFLIGDWVGEGGGQPGQASSGGTTLSFDLQGQVIVRRNFSNYHATKDRPAVSHSDLMVIYRDPDSKAFRAMYWDSEGHVINYTVSFSNDGDVVTFLSAPSDHSPRFRFIYRKQDDRRLGIEFAIAPPGKPDAFSKYADGVLHRR